MYKRENGFTIVELVIVMAAVAILSAILVPTFSSVVAKANASTAMQNCKAAYDEALATALSDGELTNNETAISGGFLFKWTVADDMKSVEIYKITENNKFTDSVWLQQTKDAYDNDDDESTVPVKVGDSVKLKDADATVLSEKYQKYVYYMNPNTGAIITVEK